MIRIINILALTGVHLHDLTHGNKQLRDPSLFKQDVCYVNGEWVKAKSGKTFEVRGELNSHHLPTNNLAYSLSHLTRIL